MAALAPIPRRPARPPDFGRLQTLVKRESLLVGGEREAIRVCIDRIQAMVEETLLLSWNVQQLGHKVDLLLNSRLPAESWLNFESESRKKFASAYSKLGGKTPVFEKFVALLWDNPYFLARPLAEAKAETFDVDDVIYAVLFSIYGNLFTPREEQAVLRIMEYLLQVGIERAESPQAWLRENTVFTRMFTVYARNFANGRMYLKAALQDPVLAVLEDDLLNLEIDPVKVFQSLSSKERLMMGLGDVLGPADGSDLANHPAMKQRLSLVYPKLISFCRYFVRCLTEKLASLPFGIRWRARQVGRAVLKKGLSQNDAFAAVGDLVFMRFISPAIVYPEPYGIVTDTPVSPQARRNLTLIAKVLKGLARGAKSFFKREPYLKPLQDKVADLNLDQLFVSLQAVGDLSEGLPFLDDVDIHCGRKLEVCMSVRNLNLLLNIVRSSEHYKATEELTRVLDKSKVSLDPTDGDLFLISISDDQSTFNLMTESEVVGAEPSAPPPPAALKGFGDDGVAAWTPAVQQTFRETKRQLRTLMAAMDVTRPWRHTGLIDVLRTEMLEASVLDRRSWEAQIGELIRLVASLPEALKHNNFQALHDEMLQDYRARAPYARYLVRLRQDLLVAQDQIVGQRERLQRSNQLYFQYHKTVQINSFVEKRENEIVAFVQHFNSIELLDEKAALVTRFLNKAMEALARDPLWEAATQEDRAEANGLLEKYFMCRIYTSAFHANDADLNNDLVFSSHIVSVSKELTTDHPSIQINPKYRSQAPWPLAQKELLKVNVYKAPGDKLQCIVQACKTIMNLITLNGAQAGADEFFPVLVYVVLQANPPNLLSTVQYIKYFYEPRANGEDSYWWNQFVIAVQFIKTLNPAALKSSS